MFDLLYLKYFKIFLREAQLGVLIVNISFDAIKVNLSGPKIEIKLFFSTSKLVTFSMYIGGKFLTGSLFSMTKCSCCLWILATHWI